MRPEPEAELLNVWLVNIDTPTLSLVCASLADDSHNWTQGDWEDDDGGECLATFIGRCQPSLKYSSEPGAEFIIGLGMAKWSEVVDAWDNEGIEFRYQLLRLFQREYFYRTGVRLGDHPTGVRHPGVRVSGHRSGPRVGGCVGRAL